MKSARVKCERSSLMNVGRRVDYAVRALSYLAGQPEGKYREPGGYRKEPGHPVILSFKDHERHGCRRFGAIAYWLEGVVLPWPSAAAAISIKDVYETVERPLVLMECLRSRAPIIVLSARFARKSRCGKKAQESCSRISRRRVGRGDRRSAGA